MNKYFQHIHFSYIGSNFTQMVKPKHILMVLESDFPPDIRVENEIEALTNEGFKITLLCTTRSNNRKKKEVYSEQLIVFRRKISTFLYKSKVGQLKFPFYDLFWKILIKKYIRQNKKIDFDIIHVHDLSLARVGIWLKKLIKTPVIFDLHENYPYLIKDAKHTQNGLGKFLSDYKQWLKFEKEIVPQADYVITVVKEMKERMLEFDNRPNNYHIYQNVVNLKSVRPYSQPEKNDVFKLVYIGGITPARGIQRVIEAIDLLVKKKIEIIFEIYGDGSYLNDLKMKTESFRLQEHIHFKGNIPQNEVFDKIKAGDASIIPHYKSVQNNCSSPNKLYQYLSAGRAVIASDCTSVKRVIEENNIGKTYEDKRPEGLAEVLEDLISNPTERIELGKRGYESVNNRFNTVLEGRKLIEFYKTITN